MSGKGDCGISCTGAGPASWASGNIFRTPAFEPVVRGRKCRSVISLLRKRKTTPRRREEIRAATGKSTWASEDQAKTASRASHHAPYFFTLRPVLLQASDA